MTSLLITLGICAASIYSFSVGNYLFAVPLMLWAATRLSNSKSKALARTMALSEWQTNSIHKFEFSINMEKVLNHSCVQELLPKIKHLNAVKGKDSATLTSHLLDNFKKKYRASSEWHSV